MILRRIASAFRRQDWFTVFVETMIVILGVFLGLQVNNWNEARQSAANERIYIERLRSDIEVIATQMTDRVAYEVEMAQWLNTTLDLMEQQPSEERRQKLGASLTKLIERGTMLVHSPTFFELQSSGNLSLIRDRALREAIIDFFAQADRFEQIVATNNSNYVDGGFATFLRDDFRMGLVIGADVAGDMMSSSYWPPMDARDNAIEDLFDSRVTTATSDILMRPPDDEVWDHLVQQLTWRAAVIGSNHAFAQEMADEARRTLAVIDGGTVTSGASSSAISQEPLTTRNSASP